MSFAYHDDESGVSGPRSAFRPLWRRVPTVIIRYWALLGGIILVALVLITAASAISNLIFDKPIQGDYEMTKHFIAIAVFCFLPYCQMTGANVTVDIFTEGMSERAKSAMLAFSSLFAMIFAVVLLRQMSFGFMGYIRFPETTATLHIPLWTAFPPALISLVLLFVAAVLTTLEGVQGIRGAHLTAPEPPVE